MLLTRYYSFKCISIFACSFLLGAFMYLDVANPRSVGRTIIIRLYRSVYATNVSKTSFTSIADKCFRHTKEGRDAERAKTVVNLANISEVRRLNSHTLPNESGFGLINNTVLCQSDDAKHCPAKFKDLDTRLRVAPQYKTSTCVIQKNMSTLMQAIMCFLADQRVFDTINRSDKTCKAFRSCKHYQFNEVREVEAKYNVTNATRDAWRHIAIVREPIDRFLSAFVDKCIRKPHSAHYCNGCGANMTCFILAEYKRTMEQSRRSWLSRTFEDLHFLPQSWHCLFSETFSRYHFLRYSSDPAKVDDFVAQLTKLLKPQV